MQHGNKLTNAKPEVFWPKAVNSFVRLKLVYPRVIGKSHGGQMLFLGDAWPKSWVHMVVEAETKWTLPDAFKLLDACCWSTYHLLTPTSVENKCVGANLIIALWAPGRITEARCAVKCSKPPISTLTMHNFPGGPYADSSTVKKCCLVFPWGSCCSWDAAVHVWGVGESSISFILC